MFKVTQNILEGKQTPSVSSNKKMINTLAGLVKCACCNHTMTVSRTTYKSGETVLFLKCVHCNKNSSSKLEVVEKSILEYLEVFLYQYKNEILNNKVENTNNDRVNNLKHTLQLLEKESSELNNQKNNLHDLLERGVYDIDTYLERTNILRSKSEDNERSIKNTIELIENESKVNLSYDELIPKIDKIIIEYKNTQNVYDKNMLLKSIIDEVIYFKERGNKFELDIKLRLPV